MIEICDLLLQIDPSARMLTPIEGMPSPPWAGWKKPPLSMTMP